MKNYTFRYAVIALTLACSLPVHAQDTHPTDRDKTHHSMPPNGKHPHGMIVGTLKHIRPDLKLTAQQSSGLDTFIKDVETRAKNSRQEFHDAMKYPADQQNLNALQQLENSQKRMEEHLNQSKANLDGFRIFYNSLQADQKKVVDQALAQEHSQHMKHWRENRHGQHSEEVNKAK